MRAPAPLRAASIRLATASNSRQKLPVMSSVPEQLRQAREAQKLTVHQVADITKIRTDHIRALEEGNYGVFFFFFYIRGFVRTYATILKLNVPEIMAALNQELGQNKKFSEPPPISGPPRGLLDFFMLQLSKLDVRKGLVALIALIVIVVGGATFLIWRHYKNYDPLADLKPGVYHSTQTVSGETLPLPAPKK